MKSLVHKIATKMGSVLTGFAIALTDSSLHIAQRMTKAVPKVFLRLAQSTAQTKATVKMENVFANPDLPNPTVPTMLEMTNILLLLPRMNRRWKLF